MHSNASLPQVSSLCCRRHVRSLFCQPRQWFPINLISFFISCLVIQTCAVHELTEVDRGKVQTRWRLLLRICFFLAGAVPVESINEIDCILLRAVFEPCLKSVRNVNRILWHSTSLSPCCCILASPSHYSWLCSFWDLLA